MVVGIIAILISLLMPALSRARAQAITVNCMSNMRQAGQAFAMYAGMNKGSLPGQMNGFIVVTDPDSWVYKLLPHANNSYIPFTCTNNVESRIDLSAPGMCYIYNGFASGAWNPTRRPARLTKARNSAECVVLADHGPLWENSWIISNIEGFPYGWVWWYPHTEYNFIDKAGKSRSVLFADFHVEQVPTNTLEQRQMEWPNE